MEQVTEGGEITGMATIKCRLYERGDGWATLQQRYVKQIAGADGVVRPVLVERNVLQKPGEEDVVVNRYFNHTDEVVEVDV
jgi:hypothetical protein